MRLVSLALIFVLLATVFGLAQDSSPRRSGRRGWFFQAIAPIKGLLSVRTSAQLIRDHRELQGLARIWHSDTQQGSLRDRIRFATFTFPGNDAPLSWAMSEKQKEAILCRWKELTKTNEKDLDWVHCTLDPSYTPCATNRELNGPY